MGKEAVFPSEEINHLVLFSRKVSTSSLNLINPANLRSLANRMFSVVKGLSFFQRNRIESRVARSGGISITFDKSNYQARTRGGGFVEDFGEEFGGAGFPGSHCYELGRIFLFFTR